MPKVGFAANKLKYHKELKTYDSLLLRVCWLGNCGSSRKEVSTGKYQALDKKMSEAILKANEY